MSKTFYVSTFIPKKYRLSTEASNQLYSHYMYLCGYCTTGSYSKHFGMEDFMKLFVTYKNLGNVKFAAEALWNSYRIGVKWKVLSECMQAVDRLWSYDQMKKIEQIDKEITKQEETKEQLQVC